VGPTDRGWKRGSLYRGDGEEVLVHGEKMGGDRGTAGEVFLAFDPLYDYFFAIGDEIGELLKLLLRRPRSG
jgi:hypothetical protein